MTSATKHTTNSRGSQPVSIESVISLLDGAQKHNGYWQARCPAHDDQRASLSVRATDDGKILLHCHAGCKTEDILAKLDLRFSDLQPAKSTTKTPVRRQVDTWYAYRDVEGAVRYAVARFKPKGFAQCRPGPTGPDGNTTLIWNMQGVDPLPYKLPELLTAIQAGQTIYIVEGEKDVDNLARIGIAATTNHGGAGKWKDQLNAYFETADVVILPDNDPPGQNHALQVAAKLNEIAGRIRILNLPELPPKGDVSDWIAAGGNADTLYGLAADTPQWIPAPPAPPAAASLIGGNNAPETDIHYTDTGNAKRFVNLHRQDVRYLAPQTTWLIWDGQCWRRDETGYIQRYADRVVSEIHREAADTSDNDERKALGEWALKCENNARLANMVSLAQHREGIPIRMKDLDRDLWLLNCQNGTLDLRTGELREHRRDDLITRCLPVDYDPGAAAPTWLTFLDRVMDGNQAMIDFLQRAAGYSLTGDTSEQCLFFMHGAGANGKSTFIETLVALLGEGQYGQRMQADTLMLKDRPGILNDLARLPGVRFVVASETDTRRLNESLVKDLTGGDTLAVRMLYHEPFEFKPACKLWLYGNHKPEIRNTDEGIWRRMRLIPFTVQIPEPERDEQLINKLIGELPGVLAWAVTGCMKWLNEGLQAPVEVKAATQAYRSEMDQITAWLNDCCELLPIVSAPARNLYGSYKAWCEQSGEHVLSQHLWGQGMTDRGFKRVRNNAFWSWRGVGLRSQTDGEND